MKLKEINNFFKSALEPTITKKTYSHSLNHKKRRKIPKTLKGLCKNSSNT